MVRYPSLIRIFRVKVGGKFEGLLLELGAPGQELITYENRLVCSAAAGSPTQYLYTHTYIYIYIFGFSSVRMNRFVVAFFLSKYMCMLQQT